MTDNGPVSNFLDGVEEELRKEETPPVTWGPVYRPGSSEVSDLSEPPDEMGDPVYSPEAGWIDRSNLPREPMVWVNPSEIE
jgi:hypothetical protein